MAGRSDFESTDEDQTVPRALILNAGSFIDLFEKSPIEPGRNAS